MRKLTKYLIAAIISLAVSGPALAVSGKAQFYKNGIVNQFFRSDTYTWPTTLTVRLYSSCPNGSGGGGTELTGNNYTAQALNPAASGTWGMGGADSDATGGSISNITAITYPVVQTSSWTVNCVALTNSGNTEMYYWGDVTGAPVTVNVGSTASFANNALVITEAANGVPALDELRAALGRPVTVADILDIWAEAVVEQQSEMIASN